MPVKSVARDQLQDEIDRLEKAGENVTQVLPDGDGAFLVFTAVKKNRYRGTNADITR